MNNQNNKFDNRFIHFAENHTVVFIESLGHTLHNTLNEALDDSVWFSLENSLARSIVALLMKKR